MINGKNVSDQPVKSSVRTYDNIPKIVTDQEDDYTTDCLLDYIYFNNYYKMMAIDLSKQKPLDADPKAVHQINVTRNLDEEACAAIFFIIEEAIKPF